MLINDGIVYSSASQPLIRNLKVDRRLILKGSHKNIIQYHRNFTKSNWQWGVYQESAA